MQRQDALLLQTLSGHKLHARSGCSLADGRRIGGIVLPALLYKRPDGLRCDQFYVMPETGQHPGPMMGRAAGLQNDCAGLVLLEEWNQLAPLSLRFIATFPDGSTA